MKELDAKIVEAQGPMDRLEQQHKQAQTELNAKISEAQSSLQEVNMEADKLDSVNKAIER